MEIIIEVSGGVVCGITATQECNIYLVDYDNIEEKDGNTENARKAFLPDRIADTKATLDELLQQYEKTPNCYKHNKGREYENQKD